MTCAVDAGIGLYRNATTFGKSAVGFYVRHEGTFFTKDFRWELADAADFLSMGISGFGTKQSAAGMASGINDTAKAYRQSAMRAKGIYSRNTKKDALGKQIITN